MRRARRHRGAFLCCLALAVLTLALPAPAPFAQSASAATRFLADMDDMPLPAGLAEIETERLVFDKPEGRIMRTAAVAVTGTLDAATIRRFYQDTLPALGWQPRQVGKSAPKGLLGFEREGEKLGILIDSGPPLMVRFAIEPR